MIVRLKQVLAVLVACVAAMIGVAALARAGYGLVGIGLVEAAGVVSVLILLRACSMLLRSSTAEGEFRPPFFVVLLGALLHRGETVPASPGSPQPPGGLAQEPREEPPQDEVPHVGDELAPRRRA
jgi:uncharacterized membrane protein YuzA (DUF378 family)